MGSRIKLSQTRAIIDAIHSGALAGIPTHEDPLFGLRIPTSCPDVPSSMLNARQTWSDPAEYDRTARTLAEQFRENFTRYADAVPDEVRQAGPRI